MVFDVRDGAIAEIVGFATTSLVPQFGLPERLP
jgi:predicted cobalt transporter CbtA